MSSDDLDIIIIKNNRVLTRALAPVPRLVLRYLLSFLDPEILRFVADFWAR